MAEFVKFIYVMIIFIFLFLVVENIDGKSFIILFKFPYLLRSHYFIPRK